MNLPGMDLPYSQPLSGIAMHAFLALAAESRPEKIPLALARAACHAFLADVCYLISPPEDNQMTCFDGFNRVKEDVLPGMTLAVDSFREISESIDSERPIIRNQVDELSDTTIKTVSILGEVRPAPFIFSPIYTHKNQLLGGLLLLSPYSGKEWTESDQTQIMAFCDSAAQILQRALEIIDLQDQLKGYETKPEPTPEVSQAWIVEETGETVATNETPTITGEEEPRTRMSPYIRPVSALETIYLSENTLLLDYIAHLGIQLQELADSTHAAMENQQDDDARKALLKIKEDLHVLLSPLSSITGYHDLLISESVGNLTEMQQRFLDRIRTAAEKLHQTIDEIEQVAEKGLPAPLAANPPAFLKLQDLVDESFKSFQQLIQDRKLEVRIQVPKDLPRIVGRQDDIRPIVQKILNSLLSISSDGSNIQSRLSMQVELNGKRNVLWKTTSQAQANNLPAKELDEFSEYLQENVFSLAERLDCQLWMDASVHTERQVNLLFPAE